MVRRLFCIMGFLFLFVLTMVVEQGIVNAKETIKIAAVFAKTGDAGASNLHHFQAMRFAIDEINKQGGVLGKKITLLEFDNCSTPIQSKLAGKKVVKADVTAVIGASWSSHSIALAPVLQKAKIPMITPDSTNPKVTLTGDYIFRTCFIDPFQGQVLAKFAIKDLNAKTAVILTDITSAYSIGLAEMFHKYFEEQNGKILAEFEYKQTDKNFDKILVKVKQMTPDVLFIPGHDEAGLIVKQAQNIGIKAVFLGGDGWSTQQFLSNGGSELKLGYLSNHWTADLDTPENKIFLEKYRRLYEVNPGAVVTYDAIMLLADAIKRAGSLDKSKIRDALANTKDFQGITGNITIGKNGDSIKQAVIVRIVDGKSNYYKSVSP